MNPIPTPSANLPPYQFDDAGALLETRLPLPRHSGKVRDIYDLGDSLLIVSSDRISAFDYILPVGIPGKGRLLTQMSQFWFDKIDTPHHLISSEVPRAVATLVDPEPLSRRIMVTRKATVIPYECVVRGYLEGSGWTQYQRTGVVNGHQLPLHLRQCEQLPEPIFTPSTKAASGHDENITFEQMQSDVGVDLAAELRRRSLQIYQTACEIAAATGILIADTKLEFGFVDGELVLIDEVLTPDSSRFWLADEHIPGQSQKSMDKQYVREWLSQCGWDKNSPPPALPPAVITRTAGIYQQAYTRLTGDSI